MTTETQLKPSGLERGIRADGKTRTIDPVIRSRFLDAPSEGGPLLVGGHTPGCRNSYGDGLDENDDYIAADGKGCKARDCECQGKEAEG